MRASRSTARRRVLPLLIVVVLVLITTTAASAATRAGDGGQMPYYARIAAWEIYHDGEWAVVMFYRPADCVPGDFNLLEFYDFGAFDCQPPTTDGFVIWQGEPWMSQPLMIHLQGLGAVPAWFVSWPEMQAAVSDGELTIGEFAGLPSLLRGSAGHYLETLHPAGGPSHGKIQYNARGLLEDGRSFMVEAVMHDEVGQPLKVRIEFR